MCLNQTETVLLTGIDVPVLQQPSQTLLIDIARKTADSPPETGYAGVLHDLASSSNPENEGRAYSPESLGGLLVGFADELDEKRQAFPKLSYIERSESLRGFRPLCRLLRRISGRALDHKFNQVGQLGYSEEDQRRRFEVTLYDDLCDPHNLKLSLERLKEDTTSEGLSRYTCLFLLGEAVQLNLIDAADASRRVLQDL